VSAADFYAGLTERNAGVVDAAMQRALREATLLVAGCGSIGGAAVEPLVRLGGCDFLLADPGAYELNNLNRQNATHADLDRNKAEVAGERVLAINPHARVRVFPDGVTAAVVEELTASCDVVVDGVDVTTAAGLEAKVLLHEHACARRLPLLTGWDMAGAQYVRVYDYRRLRRPFAGRLERADLDRLSMWQILRRVVPARYVPLEMIALARANLRNPQFAFPQLVQAADLFGALASHMVAGLLAGRPVREHVYIDLYQQARPTAARWRTRLERPLQVAAALADLQRAA
jgi:threonine dehydrogenase-like Zn-dependent dehydrogenase